MSRRRFLGAGSGAVAAAVLAPATAMAKGKKKDKPCPPTPGLPAGLLPPDRIGVQLFTVDDQVGSIGFAKVFDRLEAIGYQEIEFAGFSQGNGPITTAEIRKLMDERGLRGVGAHTSINEDNAQQVLDDAEILGLPNVGIAFEIPHYGVSVDGWKRLADDYNRVGALTAERGIRWYLHIHGPGYAPTPDSPTTRGLDVLLDETDPSLVFFEMDIFWAYFGQTYFGSSQALPFEPLDYVLAQPERFPLFHIKDGRKNAAGGLHNAEMTDVGQGSIDFQAFLSALDRGAHRYIMERDNADSHPKGSLASTHRSYLFMRHGLVDGGAG
ncbi:MAG: sugar phosphate isomerase/epimerase family protein [Actinomycetota bacterium]